MAGQKTISATYTPPPPSPPIADYHTTRATTPPSAGDYFLNGTYNGLPVYTCNPRQLSIWSLNQYAHRISATPGIEGGAYWLRNMPGLTGEYASQGTAIVDIEVLAGPS